MIALILMLISPSQQAVAVPACTTSTFPIFIGSGTDNTLANQIDFYAPSSLLVVVGETYDETFRGDTAMSKDYGYIILYKNEAYQWG